MTIQTLSKLQQTYLKEERQVLLECLERNQKNNYPYDLSKFWCRIEDINEMIK